MSAPFVCLCCEPRRKLYGSQSWTDHRTRRSEMAHPSLSRSRPRNQQTQLPQPNYPRLNAGGAGIFDEEVARARLGRDLEGAKITLNEYLDRWLETAVKPRVRQKTWRD